MKFGNQTSKNCVNSGMWCSRNAVEFLAWNSSDCFESFSPLNWGSKRLEVIGWNSAIEFFTCVSSQLLFGPLLASYFQNFPLFFFKSFYLTGTQGGMDRREVISLLSLLRNRIEFLVLCALFWSDISGSFQLREAAVILVSYETYFVGPICPQKPFI